tara:strand:+ start:2546 stop:3862 length:1317 start_codon:yes stop_codon:yes gene_type:complete
MANRRGKMDPMTALSLAKQMRAQNREMGDPKNDPMRVLQDQYYRGFDVPPGTEQQKQAYRDAIDRRLYSQPLRERRRAEAERVGTTDAVRRRIADVVKPASMAASLTPFDAGLGDLGYAAGELIDPEGTYGDAGLAAAGGLLTGGVGSGAMMARAAKEARGMKKAADRAANYPMKRENYPMKRELDDLVPVYKKGNEYQSYANKYGSGGRFPDLKDFESKISRQPKMEPLDPILLASPLAIGAAGVYGDAAIALLDDIRSSSDYGNAFSETTRMVSPEMFDGVNSLNDVEEMHSNAVMNAAKIFNETGSIPFKMKREIGKLEALMNTKASMDSSDDRAIKSGLIGFGVGYEDVMPDRYIDRMKTTGLGDIVGYEDAMIDREVQFQRSMPKIEEPPMFGPEEAPMYGPETAGMSQAEIDRMVRQEMDREIEPAIEDFGE